MPSMPILSPIPPIFGTKPHPCRRFLHHYYRDTFIESHRKPIEVPQISYGGRLTRSQLESDLTAIKSPQKSLFIVLIRILKQISEYNPKNRMNFRNTIQKVCIFVKKALPLQPTTKQ